jgi:hypothetical protein
MGADLPATRQESGLIVGGAPEPSADHRDPQRQAVQQNLRVALLPLAIVAFLLIAFIAVAWTSLAALPAS